MGFLLKHPIPYNFQQIWLQKSGTCWKNPEVIKYAEGYREDDDVNVTYKNYFNEDIRI